MNGFLPSVTLFLIGTLLLSNADSRTLNAGYIIGDLAEDFSLENYDGRMISMASYPDAKGFIIVFTSNHCPYAEAYEDRLISLHRKFADKGYPLIAINPNAPDFAEKDNMEAIRKKAKSKKFPFPYLSDSLQTVFPRFGAERTPHVFVLDAQRKVRYMGTVDDNAEASHKVDKRYVEEAINALMKGQDPSPASTLSVGCRIRLVSRDSN